MKTISTLICSLVCMIITSNVFADDGHLKIIAEEFVAGFQSGVDQYNKTRSRDLPEIKHGADAKYFFKVNNHLVEFKIADYLQNQVYLDKKLKKIKLEINEPKKIVQFLQYIIETANADDQTDVDPTRIILATLGGLEKNLQEVTIYCSLKDYVSPFGLSTCKKDNTKANMDKLKLAIARKKSACDNTIDAQAKDPSSTLYTVVPGSENDYKSVKELIVKVSESREKKVKEFFKDYLGTDEKKFASCVDVVTNGTVIDHKGSAGRVGAININDVRLSPEKEEMKIAAQKLCTNIEELRSCLIHVASNYNTVVNSNRSSKASESLPSVEHQIGGENLSK